MSSELERLRADSEVMKRWEPETYSLAGARALIDNKIARLEAEADPWREARGWLSSWRGQGDYPVVVQFIDHLAAERDRLAARVAELEAFQAKWCDSFDLTDSDRKRMAALAQVKS